MATDFEGKYLLLRDENTALKKKKNEQEATIKRMFTKLAMIEEALKKKRQSEESDNQQDPVIPVKRDLDTERFINALKNENLALRKKTKSLQERNRVLEEKVRQFQLKPHLARSAQALAQSGSNAHASASKALGGAANRKAVQSQQQQTHATKVPRDFPGATLDAQVSSARKLQRETFSSELEQALKTRLVVAEKQVVKLQHENERLRAESSGAAKRRGNNDAHSSDDDSNNEGDGPGVAHRHSRASPVEVEYLKRELRDRQAQLAILTARYDNLEANAAAEREIQEKTLEQMEAMNRQVHKLRTQLQDAIMEHEHLEARAAKASDLEQEIALVREQNRRLEDRMTSLCESPFINDAFQRKERIDRMFELEKQSEQQQSAVAHLSSENQKLQAINKELQSTVKALKHAKDVIDQEMASVRQHLTEERNARSIAAVRAATEVPVAATSREPRPRPAPVAISIPTESEKRDACSSPVRLDRSSSAAQQPRTSSHLVVNRRYDPLSLVVPPLSEISEGDSSAKHLRNRVHVLQMAHLRAMQELERCEKMLHAQTNINRELALEVEDLTARKLSASSALQSKIKELALLAEERQQRIHALEAQIRQLKYARAKLRQTAQFFDAEPASSDDDDADDADASSDVESISESLVLAARDLAPGEQLLELLVISGTFDRNMVSSNASTFVLCDFYDFESQTTPLVMGSRPEYSFSSTFRVTVDGFFLRYLASETLVLEVHQAVRGDFQLVGRALVRLSSLLRSRGVLKEHALPVKSVLARSDSRIIGTLHVVLRLSCPISEIWRLHLRSYPQDIQLLERGTTRRDASAAVVDSRHDTNDDDDDESTTGAADDSKTRHRMNELQIVVFGCRGLRSFGKKKDNSLSRIPSSYVHYQLLGFPDAFTNIVAECAAPEYDLECSKQAYVLEVDACLLRFMTKFRLWFTVFDDQVELNGGSSDDGMIGRCGLQLADLADCKPVRGWFALRDRSDEPAGEISVLIQWKTLFDVPSVLGYNLIDVEKEYTNSLSKVVPPDTSADEPVKEATPSPAETPKPLDLDAEVLTDSKLPSQQMTASAEPRPSRLGLAPQHKPLGVSKTPLNPLASDMSTVSAASEFQRRKQAFLDRMKAIASASSKSLVYEELERKQMQRRLEASTLSVSTASASGTTPPQLGLLTQHMARLHVPQALHHSAAKTVQHTYRQYRAARTERERTQQCSILDADRQLQRLFAKWPSRELEALEMQLVDKVEAEIASAAKARAVSRKQMGFVLAQSPQVAIDAALLQQLMAHFAVTPVSAASLVAHRALIHFICSVSTVERARAHDAQHAAVKVVQAMCLSVPHALATFESVGDMHRGGAMSLRTFRDALERLSVKLSARDLRMLVVLLDTTNGAEILYRAFLHMVERLSTASLRVAQAVERCRVFGLSTLREKLTLHVASEDGAMTQQDLHSVLIHASTDAVRFDAQDACALFQMMHGGENHNPDARVSMRDLVVRLELCVKHAQSYASLENTSSCYSMKTLRRLASNCRKLTCGPFSELVAAFERFDWRDDSVVPLDVFVAVAQQQGFHTLTELQLKQVAKCFGAKRDGRFTINYRQFLDWTTPGAAIDVDEVEAKLRAFAHAQAEHTVGKQVTHVLADWRSTFAAADQRSRGYLTRTEFVRVAKTALELPLSDDELRALVYSYDQLLEDQVDFAAFVQLNWSETSRAAKQVRFDKHGAGTASTAAATVSAAEVVRTLQTTFKDNGAAMLESFAEAAGGDRSCWVDERQFTLGLQQLGAQLSSADVRAVFATFGELPDRTKLDYGTFVRMTLGLGAASRGERHELSEADEARLMHALSAALQQSRDEVLAALQTLQEHCIVHRFGKVAPAVLWKLLDASGVVALVSRKAVGLLVQKFVITYRAVGTRESADDRELVSLKAVYAFLQEVASAHQQQQQTTMTIKATEFRELQLTAPRQHAGTAESTALTVLRQLLASCSDAGVDFRGEFEKLDANYSGCVTAMELKQVVLGLGLGRFAAVSDDAPPEALVGQLVRQFRVAGARDSVSYHALLHHALRLASSTPSDPEWYVATSEHLRTRIRLKAGFSGQLDARRDTLYTRLDVCFAHFDRAHMGFITLESLGLGLTALQYELTPAQVKLLATHLGVFRTGAPTISRMEFDTFVLAPYAAHVLDQLARELLLVDTSRSGDAVPRIAQLSRALLACDSAESNGALPAQAFYTCVEDVLEHKLPQTTKRTLEHLFDVARDARIAYRLFMKVISQWQKDTAAATGAALSVTPLPHTATASIRTSTSTGTATPTPRSARDVLYALYHQLSSLDFDAQVEILEEHLRRKDAARSGCILWRRLLRMFDQVGITLSRSTEQWLPQLFADASVGTSGSDDDNDPAESVIRYDKLLLALKEFHDDETRDERADAKRASRRK